LIIFLVLLEVQHSIIITSASSSTSRSGNLGFAFFLKQLLYVEQMT